MVAHQSLLAVHNIVRVVCCPLYLTGFVDVYLLADMLVATGIGKGFGGFYTTTQDNAKLYGSASQSAWCHLISVWIVVLCSQLVWSSLHISEICHRLSWVNIWLRKFTWDGGFTYNTP